jgi:hypothetical protein
MLSPARLRPIPNSLAPGAVAARATRLTEPISKSPVPQTLTGGQEPCDTHTGSAPGALQEAA